MGFEFELKYAATDAAQQAVIRHFGGDFETITMETTYFDTEKREFAAKHYSLRRRMENGISVCNLKIPLGDNARGEWECEEESITVGAKKLAAMSGNAEIVTLAEKPLIATCGAKFTRKAKLVSGEGFTAEIALDAGILLGGNKTEPLCEMELELKSGSLDALTAYAEAVAAQFGLAPEPRSKFARAKALEDSHGI